MIIISKKIFVGLVFLILILGSVGAFVSNKEKSELENRPAVKFQVPDSDSFISGKTQKNIEDSLIDQLPFADDFKRLNNFYSSLIGGEMLNALAIDKDSIYISYNGQFLFNDFIVYPTRDKEKTEELLQNNVDNIEKLVKEYPNLEFYIYYIEKDTDIDFETDEKLNVIDFLRKNIDLPNKNFNNFNIDNFDDFKKYFYKTDHHWNNLGSYKAYKDLVYLMEIGTPLDIKYKYSFDNALSGSKALETGTTGYRLEDFRVNVYNFPSMEIIANGNSIHSYGHEVEIINNPPSRISYGDYYGPDYGELIFNTRNVMGKSILILGDSYDNALLNPLATHFYKCYSVDLRYYEIENGKKFDFDSFVKSNQIDTILIIGNIDFFTLDDFLIN